MRKVDDQDYQSDDSGDLRQDELININRHFKNRRTNRNNKMTAEMETMYKEALMNVIFGQFEEASRKLKNFISLYPDNPDAFHLLGTMHEQLGQMDKAVEYFFMSTYLSPPNIQKWIKVADMSMESKMYTQAAYCYGRALKIQNYNPQLMTKRAQAFEMSHQTKKAISTYKRILSIAQSLDVRKKYAKLKFRREEYGSSRQILKNYANYIKDPNLVYMICQTYLKQKKYEDILKEIGMHLDRIQIQDDPKDLKDQPLQFVKIVYISCVILKRSSFQYFRNTVQEMKTILLESYEQGLSELYQDIIEHLKQQQEVRYTFTELLIKHAPHKTIKNYLFISEYLKTKHQYNKAIQYLKQGLKLHNQSAQLSSQLNHMQVISGKLKPIKLNERKKITFDQNNQLKSKKFQDDQIFYSSEEQEQDSKYIKVLQNNDKKKQKANKIVEKGSNLQKEYANTKQMETDNPQVIKQLLQNSNITLESILQKKLQQKEEISFNNKQVENCLQYIIKVTQNCKSKNKQQKQGLFHRVQPRRRYFSSKKNSKLSLVESNVQIICKILQNCILYFHKLLELKEYLKIKSLCQLLSKGYFFRWQNRNKQLKKLKTLVYEIGLLVCLILKKFDSASYFIRYLVNRHPQNEFYLLIVTYLIHNSQNKQCINSLLSKHLNKQQSNINQQLQQKQGRIFSQSQEEQNLNGYQAQLQMKKINKSSINVNVNYLLGIQYMQTGCFQLAISSFLKIINQMSKSMKITVWLSISACFLQLSSSRTTHTKLPYTNRSSYCFLQYLKYANNSIESRYNKARWLAQIKLNDKAIKQFNQLLKINQISQSIKDRCVLNLLCIYKQMQNWTMVEQLSRQYFNAQKYIQKQILQHQSKLVAEQQIQGKDKTQLMHQEIFQEK